MEYLKQFTIILAVTCVGEIMKMVIPLPIPGSIYGLVLMLGLLISGKLRIERVEKATKFLVEIMPVMFIPAAVGLMSSWDRLQPILLPVSVITVVSTVLVMAVTGRVTDFMIVRKKRGDNFSGCVSRWFCYGF